MKNQVFIVIGVVLFILITGVSHKEIIQDIIESVSEEDQPMVALSFDDGPHPQLTQKVLEELEEYDYHATFYILGVQIEGNEEIIQAIINQGSELGMHTYSHKDLSRSSEQEILAQIDLALQELSSFIPYEHMPTTLRPPYGNYNQRLLDVSPYPLVKWSVDSLDWSLHRSEKIVSNIMRNIEDGDIILMHDIYEASYEATLLLLQQLHEQGYEVVGVSELFEHKNIELERGNIYYHAQ